MPDDWLHGTLEDFVALQRGHDLTEAERRPGLVPVMGCVGQNGFHDTFRAPGPGVVVGRSGASFGSIHYCPVDYWPHNTALYVTDFKGNDPRFAYYLLKSIDFQRYNSGSAQPSLNRNYIYSIPLRYPLPPAQLAIASVLGTLDDKIELNRRINRTLESLGRAVFKAWFVDFEPVNAKAAGAASFPGMPQDVFDKLPSDFEASEIGPVPVGWAVHPLGDAATISRDALTPGDYPEEAFDHYSIPAFDQGRAPAIDLGSTIKSNKYIVTRDCVLVSKLNPRTQRVWLPDDSEVSSLRRIASTEFLVVRPCEGWSREHIYCQVTTADFQVRMASHATGTSNSHQRVRPQDFLAMRIVASPAARDAFSNIVGPLFEKVRNNLAQNRVLAQLRDALSPKLLSGSLRVPSDAA